MPVKQYWEREKWRANERTLSQHRRLLDEVSDNRKYPFTGMFHLANLKLVQHDGGYEMIFWNGDSDYTPQEYAMILNEILRYSTNHEAEISKTAGLASISFHIPNKRDAFRLSRKYGNNSVWDFVNREEIRTERRLRR